MTALPIDTFMDLTEYTPSDIKSLPNTPGIYFYFDQSGEIIYIGKAKRLKARVSQYFQNKPLTRRLRNLVSQIVTIKLMLTETESDALILENRMIKKHKPKYNVLLKDDKTYPYICLTAHPFPRVTITRKRQSNKGAILVHIPMVIKFVVWLRCCRNYSNCVLVLILILPIVPVHVFSVKLSVVARHVLNALLPLNMQPQ